jgi:tRNA(adenine34) deaminase
MMNKHEEIMNRCLQLAMQAKSAGKTAVGSLIIRDNKVIAEGIEGSEVLPAILAHAEIIAIEKAVTSTASKDLSGCMLYTTVEPCFMCSYLIRETKITTVVYGAKAGTIGGVNSEHPILVSNSISKWSAPPVVFGGVLEAECLEVLKKS